MHIGKAAGIAVQGTKQHVGIVMGRREGPPGLGAGNLVGLLVILFGGKIVIHLRGKGIVGHPLQIIGPERIAGNTEHGFKGVHHFHGSAKLAAAGGAAKVEHFIARPKACGQPYGVTEGFHCFEGSLQVPSVMGILPPDQGGFETLAKVYAVHTPLP